MAATDDNMADYMELNTNIAFTIPSNLDMLLQNARGRQALHTQARYDAERSRYTVPPSTLGLGESSYNSS